MSERQNICEVDCACTSENNSEENDCMCCPFFKNRQKVKKVNPELTKPDSKEMLRNTLVSSFSGDLPKVLKTGTTIFIYGFVQPICSRFALDLTCGKGSSTDIAFHLNPRLAQRYLVRNSRLNGQWGEEETTSIVKFDFPRNKKFLLNIFIADGEFLVSLNGRHICAFRFRVPLSKVTGIAVKGLVEIYKVEYKELKIYPEPIPENKTFTVILGKRQDEIPEILMDSPISFLLHNGFHTNWQLEIYGKIKILPNSFYVNLQEGSQTWPHPIIPLHLSLRFGTVHGEHLFVRNAWIDGRWGQEERAPGFQFSPGSPFTMAIRRGDEHFSVWIDGKLAGEFKFRGDNNKIDTLYIQGDIIITKVFLNQNP